MKKAIIGMSVFYSILAIAIAGMDDVEFTATDLKPSYTQTNSFVMRGFLERVELTASSTELAIVSNTVTITSGSATLFSYACTNDATFYPRMQVHDYAGSALEYTTVTNADGVIATNKLYDKFPVAGSVTVTQAGLGPATNDWKVKLVFLK